MFDSSEFTTLVKKGQPTGEVVGVNRFLVTLIGLETAPIGGLILFENGQHGLVREVAEDHVIVLNLDSE
ncbi:MAG TPA: sodium-transporting two-sector ATPase, partial [Candidatus Saccharimonadales bacterium]|nr:sodium-transporting two-sector ATPase [Candidatus Saccharimonadales bacterium]